MRFFLLSMFNTTVATLSVLAMLGTMHEIHFCRATFLLKKFAIFSYFFRLCFHFQFNFFYHSIIRHDQYIIVTPNCKSVLYNWRKLKKEVFLHSHTGSMKLCLCLPAWILDPGSWILCLSVRSLVSSILCAKMHA